MGGQEDMELLKAVAQAWHAQTGNPKPTAEFDAQKGSCPNFFRPRPTRFKLEAAAAAARRTANSRDHSSSASARWDFAESLLDSYEIVSLSRKLEANLSLDQPASVAARATKRRRERESKHSLRSLFSKLSSDRN